MFEDFSFLSSTTTIPFDTRWAHESISPLSSRCSSPFSPTFPSQTFPYQPRDLRFQSSRTSSIDSLLSPSRRLSIDTLTSQFDSHSPFEPNSNEYLHPQPRSIPIDEDEGFDEPSSFPLDQDISQSSSYNFDTAQLPPLGYPSSSSTSLSNSNLGSGLLALTNRRRQRQLLTRLQCLTAAGGLDAHLSILVEECHPSSIPLQMSNSESDRASGDSRRKLSITSAGVVGSVASVARTERRCAIVKRAPRLRKKKN